MNFSVVSLLTGLQQQTDFVIMHPKACNRTFRRKQRPAPITRPHFAQHASFAEEMVLFLGVHSGVPAQRTKGRLPWQCTGPKRTHKVRFLWSDKASGVEYCPPTGRLKVKITQDTKMI